MHTALRCGACQRDHAIDQLQNLCVECHKPLLAEYDFAGLRGSFTPQTVRDRRHPSLWRFAEVLPVDSLDEAVSLGEGLTPLLPAIRRGPFARFERLFVKDEGFNPTGSFKARGMTAAVTRAKALGAKAVALPSAGNAAGAAAAYAAAAGLDCHVFVPEDTPRANILESIASGANVYLVNGLIHDCGKLVRQASQERGWFDLSTLKEPFRVEGKKTMGYELALDLADDDGTPRLPDVILYPTGGGTGLIGMWKAFDEMEQLGWIGSERPRMVAVQAEGCRPIVDAFHANEEFAAPAESPHTLASGLRVPVAVGDFLMLRALRESNGTAVAIADNELLHGSDELARHQGMSACPEAGAVWKAAERLMDEGWITEEETVVLFNTGTALKYSHLIEVGDLPVLDHTADDWLDQLD